MLLQGEASFFSWTYRKGIHSGVTRLRKQRVQRKRDRKLSNSQRSVRKIHWLSSGYFSIPFLLTLPFQWVTLSPRLKFQLITVCPVTPEILLIAKDQKQGKKTLNFTGSLFRLVSETAQTPAANDAQPCLHRAKSRAPWEPNSPLGFGRLHWEKVAISSQLLTFVHNLHKLCFEVCLYFFEVRSLLFPPVFLFMRLCFLLLAGPGSGSAEQQERVQPCCWLRSESLCSSDFAAAFQISVPKKIQILI